MFFEGEDFAYIISKIWGGEAGGLPPAPRAPTALNKKKCCVANYNKKEGVREVLVSVWQMGKCADVN